jgi:NADH-quinone oxidoreductase subunit L
MDSILLALAIIPFIGFLLSFIPDTKSERAIHNIALITISLFTLLSISLIFLYNQWTNGQLSYQALTLYRDGHVTLTLAFYADILSIVYAVIGGIIGLMVIRFSKFYMHRDRGYKRFFSHVLLFYVGYSIVVFSGTFTTLFIGWEILGITSFLLIGFYRQRFLPTKNALKVFSYFRLSDFLLLLAVWIIDQLAHKEIYFGDFAALGDWSHFSQSSPLLYTGVAILIFTVAAIKSGQFPFSSWVPRAMEGPTTSTAIFYGSLSIHIGVFLLLRLYPLWDDSMIVRLFLGVGGVISSIIAFKIARVQSTVKTQIAFHSISQIGIMFIELSLGWYWVALAHFVSNAFFRTYQLLVSPSVLNYLIHHQYSGFEHPSDKPWTGALKNINSTIYILSTKEWNMDYFWYKYVWQTVKKIGELAHALSGKWISSMFILICSSIYVSDRLAWIHFDEWSTHIIALIAAAVALLWTLSSLAYRGDAINSWILLILSQISLLLSMLFNHMGDASVAILFLSGIIVAAGTGYYCLYSLAKMEGKLTLDKYYGHIYEYKTLGTLFLLSALGIAGFPLTPSFIGVDILLTHQPLSSWVVVIIMGVNILFIEISALRIYSRVFLGQHIKAYHPIAFRSS